MRINDFKSELAESAEGGVESLQSVYASWHAVEGIVRVWVDCVGDSQLENAASWLLKHWVESGHEIDSGDQHILLTRLDAVTSATFGVFDMSQVKVTVAVLDCSAQVEAATAFDGESSGKPRGPKVPALQYNAP